jgi:hypothetical protein
LASIGQIAAGIAHEVRNPLTAVKGFLQLLGEQNPHNYIDIAKRELDNAIDHPADIQGGHSASAWNDRPPDRDEGHAAASAGATGIEFELMVLKKKAG